MEDESTGILHPIRYRGYARLQDNQNEFTQYAASKHVDWVEIWYRLFNDYDAILSAWRKLKSIPFPQFPRMHQLSLHFALATGGLAKVAFDCALAGYYAQSLMMTRQLFEIWLRLEYVKLQPEAASNWFPVSGGSHPQPPQNGTVLRGIRAKGDEDLKAVVEIVDRNMNYLNKASHASEYVFQQTVTDIPQHYQSGGNYSLSQCLLAMNDGTAAFNLVLISLARLIEVPPALLSSLLETSELVQEIVEKSTADIELYREELRKNPHWILDEVEPGRQPITPEKRRNMPQ